MMYLFNNSGLAETLRRLGFRVIANNSNEKLPYAVLRDEKLDEWLKSNYTSNDLVLSDVVCF